MIISPLSLVRPANPKILLSVLRTAYVRIFRFLTRLFADAPPINQNKTVSKVKFPVSHFVRTACELTSSIIQTHYTPTTLFCLHLRKSFLIEDHRTQYISAPEMAWDMQMSTNDNSIKLHQCSTIGFADNELKFVHVATFWKLFVFWEMRTYIHTAGRFPY